MTQKLTGLKTVVVNMVYASIALIVATGMATAFQPLTV